MSFQKSAYSLRSRLHFGEVRLPALVGIAVIVVAVAVCIGYSMVTVANSQTFSVTHAQDGAVEEETSEEALIEPSGVFVHVAGCVVAPGVYEMPADSRVSDAIQLAGGFAEGANESAINLARVVADGEQIVVPALDAGGEENSAVSGALASGGKVNINTADADELMTLDGVGEATARRIVEDRQANGPFTTTEDLKRVSGIGDKKFAAIADRICV